MVYPAAGTPHRRFLWSDWRIGAEYPSIIDYVFELSVFEFDVWTKIFSKYVDPRRAVDDATSCQSYEVEIEGLDCTYTYIWHTTYRIYATLDANYEATAPQCTYPYITSFYGRYPFFFEEVRIQPSRVAISPRRLKMASKFENFELFLRIVRTFWRRWISTLWDEFFFYVLRRSFPHIFSPTILTSPPPQKKTKIAPL